jgi:hypothetical protein
LVDFDPLGAVTSRRTVISIDRFRARAFLPAVVNCTRTAFADPGATF